MLFVLSAQRSAIYNAALARFLGHCGSWDKSHAISALLFGVRLCAEHILRPIPNACASVRRYARYPAPPYREPTGFQYRIPDALPLNTMAEPYASARYLHVGSHMRTPVGVSDNAKQKADGNKCPAAGLSRRGRSIL